MPWTEPLDPPTVTTDAHAHCAVCGNPCWTVNEVCWGCVGRFEDERHMEGETCGLTLDAWIELRRYQLPMCTDYQ